MLYPQSNKFRSTTCLNGIWGYKLVNDDYTPVKKAVDTHPMAVPASINDIVTDKRIAEYVGKVLFETQFSLPQDKNKNYRLRIGSASHKCEVYLNGEKIGEGINGHLPVDLPLENIKDENRLSVIVDNRLDNHTLPMGMLKPGNKLRECTSKGYFYIDGEKENFPEYKQVINHDFYNFTGIHRDVIVYSLPKKGIEDVIIKTVVGGDYKKVNVKTVTKGKVIKYTVSDGETVVCISKTGDITIENPVLWSCENPHLYTLTVETENDCYKQRFGIRKVSYDDKGLYLNDKPVYLKGFGKHEDFFVSGKGNNSAVNVRDFELLKWINANSIRTSHYPYAEEIYDLADLPITAPEETKFNEDNKCADLFDFISLNRYYGWYDEIGNLAAVEPLFKADFGKYYEKFRKPIIVAEFGADTVEGVHSLYSNAFSEEYQRDYLAECCRVFDNMPYVVGEHVWNFADFKTKEGTLRVRGNRKGVFTKEREPKAAAFLLKKRWENEIKK